MASLDKPDPKFSTHTYAYLLWTLSSNIFDRTLLSMYLAPRYIRHPRTAEFGTPIRFYSRLSLSLHSECIVHGRYAVVAFVYNHEVLKRDLVTTISVAHKCNSFSGRCAELHLICLIFHQEGNESRLICQSTRNV